MDHDETGGWCPKCDGEFASGITECPDCAIPLIGADEERPSAPATPEPDGPTMPAIDPRWAIRLTVIAAACAAAVLAQVVGALLTALSFDGGGAPAEAFRHQRVRYLLQVATPGVAIVALAGGLAVAGARWLGDDRRWAQLAVFAAAAVLVALTAVGVFADLAWDDDFIPFQNGVASLAGRTSVLVLAGVAGWLSEAWLVPPRRTP